MISFSIYCISKPKWGGVEYRSG